MTHPHTEAERIVNEVHCADRLTTAGVPEHLHAGLIRYLVDRIKPGDFLSAVLVNDLEAAVLRADEQSFAALPNLVRFLHNDAPATASGSRTIVAAWLQGVGEVRS